MRVANAKEEEEEEVELVAVVVDDRKVACDICVKRCKVNTKKNK
jgi:NAD-dependent dihydropyrimidine dehydrogenase PreA subunit